MKLINQIFFIVLLSLACHSTYSFLFFNRSEQSVPIDCCAPACGSPLECGSYDVQFQAGVCPIRWNNADRANVSAFAPFVISPTLFLFRNPQFSTFYHIPWIIGGQAGYAWSDHTRLYVEVNYLQAKGKQDARFFTDSIPSLPADITLTKYKLFDAYIGGRYYSARCWCDRVAFFLGGKIGLTRHHSNEFDLVVGVPQPVNQTVLLDVPVLDRQTVISGGINGGLDVCCGNWSLVITGEVVISKGPQVADDLLVSPAIANIFTLVFFGKVGTELRFPVTAGIRYTF
jgi:hypothetical protein